MPISREKILLKTELFFLAFDHLQVTLCKWVEWRDQEKMGWNGTDVTWVLNILLQGYITVDDMNSNPKKTK